MRVRKIANLIGIPLAVMLTCATSALADDQVAAISAQAVTVNEWDKSDGTMGITLSKSSLKAGAITFTVTNNTSMNMPHEILIVPTQKDLTTLPLEASGSRIDEEKLEGLEEGVELEPGKSSSKTISLAPGGYMLFCNEPGHFAAGMHQLITVAE